MHAASISASSSPGMHLDLSHLFWRHSLLRAPATRRLAVWGGKWVRHGVVGGARERAGCDVCSSSPTTGGAQGVSFTRVFPLLAPGVVTGRLHCIGATANAAAPRTVAQL